MNSNPAAYNGIFKLASVGCYSFAASSLAIMVQLLSAGDLPPEAARPLSRLAFTIVPLFACGLGLDFARMGQPPNPTVSWGLFVMAAALIGFSASSLQHIFGMYAPAVGQGFGLGMVVGAILYVVASALIWLLGRPKS